MDANKLKKLREIGYKISPSCRICVHGRFPSTLGMWGTCMKFSYDHLKHSDQKRELSVNAFGSCENDFEIRDISLELYQEFFSDGK